MKNLTPELRRARKKIVKYAREYGLDPFKTVFQILDYDEMNAVAAYGGFPTRYPHWSFGMEYNELKKSYAYGLHKIYEMVINNDPSYAYLLENNALVDQKIVIAHVYGHTDFFKNNYWFSQTNRKMMDAMANHGTIIREYEDKYGQEVVETFLDICLTIDDLIDFHSLFIKRNAPKLPKHTDEEVRKELIQFKSKGYMNGYINPPKFMKEQEEERALREAEDTPFPLQPEKDILMFLIENADIENWQKMILSIIRDEAYYFAPQRGTKVINEGWAAYWHTTIMTQKALMASEVIDYADHHSGTVAMRPGEPLNPYKLGIELFRDIEERWNTGRYGTDYEDCDNAETLKNWEKITTNPLGMGRQKIFQVRQIDNDITFLDNYLTKEFVLRHKLFTFDYNNENERFEISDREFREVKQRLLFMLTNFGKPIIRVTKGNFGNRSELLLEHQHEGIDLDLNYARQILTNLYKIWKRPVYISTFIEEEPKYIFFDGNKGHIADRDEKPGI